MRQGRQALWVYYYQRRRWLSVTAQIDRLDIYPHASHLICIERTPPVKNQKLKSRITHLYVQDLFLVIYMQHPLLLDKLSHRRRQYQ